MTATLTRTPARTLTRPISTAAAATAAADQNDRDLMAQMGRGDRAAWGELYRRHRATVTRYVRNRVAVEADVEDLVHETFLHAWHTAGEYRPEQEQGYPVRSWLCGRAGQALRRYSWNDRHAYHAAVDATRDALRRPVTETSAEREARALSEPVAAAVAGLAPAERQAISLRYLDGLSEAQAAEVRGCTGRAIRSSAEAGRRKLTGALADLAPEARSPLQEMARQQVARIALATVGYDNVPAAQEWLRERGARVSTTTLYQARRAHDRAEPGTHTPAAGEPRPARPAYTPPEDITTLPPSDRARAAGRDYRTRHGRLPSISQLADATGVAHATAARALRQLKTDHHAQSEPTADTAHPGTGSGRQAGTVDTQPARPGSRREHASPRQDGEHEALTRRQQPDTTGAATVPVVEHAADRYADGRRSRDDQARGPVADPGASRHRVRVHSQAAHTTPASRDDATGHRHAASRAVGEDTAAEDDTSTAPPAEVSIARARVALAVLTAHRAGQAQRRAGEQARVEQLNRWHHDDDKTTGRDDGEGHER